MATLKLLSNAKSPNLIDFDREGIIDDVVAAIKNDPDWNSLWDGELLQNASFMIMNYFAFMAEKGYVQFNKSIRENFLYEAKDPISVANILAQRNINLFQNRAASVKVSITLQEGIITDGMLSTDLNDDKVLSIINGLKIIGSDINQGSTLFEIIPIAIDGKPDYKNETKVVIGQSNRITFETDAIAGQTFQEPFLLDAEHERNFYIDLETTDIIENSIRVYWEYGTPEEIELTDVSSFGPAIKFLNSEDIARWGGYFPFGLPSYIPKFNTNGGCRVYFGNDSFGGSFKNQEGKILTVFVRSGGGTISNINAQKIDYLTLIPVNSVTDLPVRITNELAAGGGADRESLAEAKIFAPLRNENAKTVVGDQDAINILRTLSVKQKVQSPIYSSDNTVPILHSHNFIVPQRNFNNFVLPTVLTNDTKETYNAKFLQALDDFLNLQGLRDGIVINEVLASFFYDSAEDDYNQFVKLKDSNPMNGSLVLKAYKYNGAQTDQIEFALSYLTGVVFNTSKRVPARVYSSVPFVNITSTFSIPSGQNRIILNFDESGDIEIELATITYVDPTQFALAFNTLIQAALLSLNPDYFNPRSSFTWVYYDTTNKRLIFESPTIGYGSSIRIKQPSIDSAVTFFGLSVGYNIPLIKTENVFLDDTTYNVSDDEVFLSIRRNSMPREVVYDEAAVSTILVQNPNAKDGPIFEVVLKDKNDIELDRIRENSNIFIEFYTDNGNVLVLTEDYRAKVPLVTISANTVVNNYNGVGSLTPPANSIVNYDKSTFDYANSKLTLAFVDSNGVNNALPIVPPYIGNFDASIDNAKITYKYKIPKTNLTDDANAGLWNGSETANILTAGASVNIPLGFQIKDNTDIKVTIIDGNGNTVEGTATLLINSSNIIGNITFTLNTFPTCYANALVITKTGSPADFATFTLQNGFNFGTSFAAYPPQRKIDKVKIEYINEGQVVETITTLTNPEFFVQDGAQGIGPSVTKLLEKDADTISTDVDILIEALAGLVVKESISISNPLDFNNLNTVSFIVGPVANPLGFFKNNGGVPDITFNRITSGPDINKLSLYLKVKDSLSIANAPVPPYLINPLLSTVKKMIIKYERKTYEVITADYKQDIYYPVGEAKAISDILNSSSAKMMSFHHLFRKVDFIPIGLEIDMNVRKGYSPSTAVATTKQLLLDNFGYENFNYNHDIGEGFIYSDVNTLINRGDLNQGVDSAVLVSPSDSIADASTYGNVYYFILPDFILDQIYFLEQQNAQISGVADTYKVKINPKRK